MKRCDEELREFVRDFFIRPGYRLDAKDVFPGGVLLGGRSQQNNQGVGIAFRKRSFALAEQDVVPQKFNNQRADALVYPHGQGLDHRSERWKQMWTCGG